MEITADTIIDDLGGTSATAKLARAPSSTVHSWRKNGITPSRMAHLKLAAAEAGIDARWPDHDGPVPGRRSGNCPTALQLLSMGREDTGRSRCSENRKSPENSPQAEAAQ